MPRIVSILFGASFTVAVMWALGNLLFSRVRIRLHALEHHLLAFVIGGPLLSSLIFALCAAHAARTWIFLVIGIAALAVNWRRGTSPEGSLPRLSARWRFVFSVPFVLFALLYLSNSLAPEVSPDGQTGHLGLVFRFFREHGFHRITTNMYAGSPLGVEMLYLFAFSFGRHSAAATVHCCYLLVLPLLILGYARRIGKPAAGVCGALLVFLAPVAGVDGVGAYNGVALATTAFALFCLLEIWREADEPNDRLLVPVGLLAGFCVAIRLGGVVAPLYAFTVILLRKKPKALVPVASAAALIVAPWLIKDWLWFGNPVSPFLNRVFPNPYIHVAFEEGYRAYLRNYGMDSFLPLFRMLTVSGGPGGGLIGPLFLLAPVALFALRSRAGRHCLLAAGFFLAPYPINIATRFLLPALPFIALALAVALEFSPVALALLIVLAAVLGWPTVLDNYARKGERRIAGFEWPAALRIIPQDDFLRARSPGWVAAQALDYYVPRGKHVWSSTPIAEAYGDTDVMIGSQSAEGELIQDILTSAVADDQAPSQIYRFTFPPRLFERLRIEQTGWGSDLWSISEMHVFSGDTELPRTASWKLDAAPFPWDIGFAFDRTPVTRWRSWESIRPGMHVDVDFGKPVEIDRIEILSAHDQPNVRIRPEVCDAVECGSFAATAERSDVQHPGDLRALAAKAVKARGIDYLLIDDPFGVAADMRSDPARWGVQFIAERSPYRIYRIQ